MQTFAWALSIARKAILKHLCRKIVERRVSTERQNYDRNQNTQLERSEKRDFGMDDGQLWSVRGGLALVGKVFSTFFVG